eukprot:GHUV01037631.1.p1 GENE.GHUV01037631.1~~GHUV01037631.1.p1  ORF type:complete len:137 (+),score=56.48 GHUV01037631.1:191-601(+)
MFGTAPHEGGDAPQQTATSKAAPAAAASSRPASAANGAAAALPAGAKVVKKTVALPVHPQAGIGGHQMPVAGRIGGAKGVGASSGSAADDLKRKREEGSTSSSKKPLDPAEAEALARREAARKRVEARTKAGFGLT